VFILIFLKKSNSNSKQKNNKITKKQGVCGGGRAPPLAAATQATRLASREAAATPRGSRGWPSTRATPRPLGVAVRHLRPPLGVAKPPFAFSFFIFYFVWFFCFLKISIFIYFLINLYFFY
jgi:pilus assembly protein TadC